ncbi:leucine rich adaptor protein 1 [Pholidichthys leucotaenia]
MDEGAVGENVPDLKDIEVKIGRKTPEGLLRWMREEAACSLRTDAKLDGSKDTGMKSLDEKLRKLKVEMAQLRSVDVKILQQLLAVHEGIEAVKWLLEERSTLTSRCSSLTSSQYSLGEGPDTSWRGSWSSLQDPNDKLDNISIGSYLDTLADDMDEYCPSNSESVASTTTPLVSEGTGGRTPGGPVAPAATAVTGPAVCASSGTGADENGNGTEGIAGPGNGVNSAALGRGIGGSGTGKPPVTRSNPQAKSEGPKQDTPVWPKSAETGKRSSISKDNAQTQAIKANGILEKKNKQTGSPVHHCLVTSQSPKLKTYKNGKIDLDTCKMNGKMHLEYDAHWRWVQSQEDVTFL